MIKSFWRNLQAPLTTLLAALILCVLVGGPTALLCSASYLYWTTGSIHRGGGRHRHPFYL